MTDEQFETLCKILVEIKNGLVDVEEAIKKTPILVMPGGVVTCSDGSTLSLDLQRRLVEAKEYFDMARRGYMR